jgi:hypothetical protein
LALVLLENGFAIETIQLEKFLSWMRKSKLEDDHIETLKLTNSLALRYSEAERRGVAAEEE